MKKSIGIITILKVNNYGAELQAFALQRKLQLMGYDAEIIDYLFYKHPRHIREAQSMPFYPYPLKRRIKEALLPMIERIKSLRHINAERRRKKGFEDFHERNTKFSQQTYRKYTELYANPPLYDAYCVGSDQVWNPNCYTSLYPYFLTFAPQGATRFSYASSFGVTKIPDSARHIYKECLEKLDYISVREKTGVRLVKELCGRDALNVLDPTMLLDADEWMAIADTKGLDHMEYILIYELTTTPFLTECAMMLSEQTGIKVVRICKGAFRQDPLTSPIENVLDASPDRFLGLFSRAKVVLTNSFHGTVFSILFKKDFYTILKRSGDRNSRVTDLLGTLSIDRICYDDVAFEERCAIDYDRVDESLDILRRQSLSYIRNAIER